MKVSVYRCMNAQGVVIYIGMSRSIVDRFLAHKAKTPWIDEVSSVHADFFEDEVMAAKVERAAIALHKPKHNTSHTAMADHELARIEVSPGTAGFGRPPTIQYTEQQAMAIIRMWHDQVRKPADIRRDAEVILGVPEGTLKPHWVRDLVIKYVGTAQRQKPDDWNDKEGK